MPNELKAFGELRRGPRSNPNVATSGCFYFVRLRAAALCLAEVIASALSQKKLNGRGARSIVDVRKHVPPEGLAAASPGTAAARRPSDSELDDSLH